MNPDFLLKHYASGLPWPDSARLDAAHADPEADPGSGADTRAAYRLALAVRAARMARGERPRGYKVGFTNRNIWPVYGVSAPIWGTVWDSTLIDAPSGRGVIALDGTCQPRLEPEVAFGLAATPPPGAPIDALFACLDWVAPSFEVVQCHRPGWRCTLPETVADGALHARLMLGARQSVRALAPDGAALNAQLARLSVVLVCADAPRERGVGANVLDGPLYALRHFVREHQACAGAPPLGAGDIVSTGTWTDAWPVKPGERWRAAFDAPLGALDVAFC